MSLYRAVSEAAHVGPSVGTGVERTHGPRVSVMTTRRYSASEAEGTFTAVSMVIWGRMKRLKDARERQREKKR